MGVPVQRDERLVAGTEQAELVGNRPRLRDHLVERRTITALQAGERGEAILDRLEPLGRTIDRVGVVAQGPRRVVEWRHHRLARIEDRLEARVEGGELGETFPHRRQAGHRRVVVVVERAVGLAGEPGQLLGVGDHGLLRFERLVLPRLRGHLVDLVTLELQHVEALGPRAARRFEARQRVARVDQSRVRGGQGDALAVEASVAIEERQLHRRVEQRLVLVLAVEIDQRADRLPQRRGRDELPVEEGAAPALGGDLASDDQLVAGRRVEHCLDYRRFFA